jgi:hypothetical protein
MDTPSPMSQPSALLAFHGSNVLSFKEPFDFFMTATRHAESGHARSVEGRHDTAAFDVHTVAGVFGANASGKSNFLKALALMRRAVLTSFHLGLSRPQMVRRRFLLDARMSGEPTLLELDLVLEGTQWTYGFECDDSRVLREWAHWYPHGRKAVVFERDGMAFRHGSTIPTVGRLDDQFVRVDSLYLSTASVVKPTHLTPLFAWFERNLALADSGNRFPRQWNSVLALGDDDTVRARKLLQLLRAADLGVTGVKKLPLDPEHKEMLERTFVAPRGLLDLDSEGFLAGGLDGSPGEGEWISSAQVQLLHQGSTDSVAVELDEESLGTQVWLALVGPVLDALDTGSVLLADELDASLHPALVLHLVRLFQERSTNPRGAQLIFNSHDPTLLGDGESGRVLGRDQVWFTEKGPTGASRLRSLAELAPRKGEAIRKNYLGGRYGALPILAWPEFEAALDADDALPVP